MTEPLLSPRTRALTPALTQMVIDLLSSASSLREIAMMLGLPQKSVQEVARPFVVLLHAQGALKPCACGKPRFHRGGCTATIAKIHDAGGLSGLSMDQAPTVLARRAEILDAIMSGEKFADIRQRLGMGTDPAKYLRFLTPEQRAIRKQMELMRDGRLRVGATPSGSRRRTGTTASTQLPQEAFQ